MKKIVSTLLLTLLPLQAYAAPTEDVEPVRSFTLQIGKASRQLTLDTPLTVPGSFTDPTVKLTAASTRRFPYGGISFEYPAQFTWEADVKSSAYKAWTLSGNDLKIMYSYSQVPIDPRSYAEKIGQKFPGGMSAIQSKEFELGSGKTAGIEFTLKIGSYSMRYRTIQLKLKSGYGLLSIQDADNDGMGSTEGAEIPRILKSLQVD
ncbi:MAG: hypothetical protein U0136_13195 [Bdellovibrionota bacterium]